ncbi:MAG: hypothetical protein U1E23_16170 [Reyranellaceae bacterium]
MQPDRPTGWHPAVLTVMLIALTGMSGAAEADNDQVSKRKKHHASPYYVVVPAAPVRSYAAPAVVYAPTPVVYAPPPVIVHPVAPVYGGYVPYVPAPSINITIPLR